MASSTLSLYHACPLSIVHVHLLIYTPVTNNIHMNHHQFLTSYHIMYYMLYSYMLLFPTETACCHIESKEQQKSFLCHECWNEYAKLHRRKCGCVCVMSVSLVLCLWNCMYCIPIHQRNYYIVYTFPSRTGCVSVVFFTWINAYSCYVFIGC